MGQRYPHSAIWNQNIVVFLHISGVRSIFLLFYDHQYIECQSHEIEMSISQPISTHKNIKDPMGKRYPYSTIWNKKL